MRPRTPRRRSAGALLTAGVSLVALTALTSVADATLVYTKGASTPSVWIAGDDGSGARRLAAGGTAHVSPDGATVSYVTPANPSNGDATLRVVPAAGGPSRDLLPHVQYAGFAWSPDGRWIVAQSGRETGRRTLVLIDVASGARRTLARGYVSGASFSPDSSQLVYDLAAHDTSAYPDVDLYVSAVAGGPARRLTRDHRSESPVWGPTTIAYAHWARPTGRHRHEDGPKYNLRLIRPDGSGRRVLTKTTVPWLLAGLFPTAWSADGSRLLAELTGQDTSYAVAVDPVSGKQRRLGGAAGPAGTALSRDGSTILAGVGFPGEPASAKVVALPYGGGPSTTLASGGYDPDWNR